MRSGAMWQSRDHGEKFLSSHIKRQLLWFPAVLSMCSMTQKPAPPQLTPPSRPCRYESSPLKSSAPQDLHVPHSVFVHNRTNSWGP